MAYEFNGTNQYLSCAAPVNGLSYPWTFACWFKPDNTTSNGAMLSMHPANGPYWGLLNLGTLAGDPIASNYSAQNALTDGAQTTAGFTTDWNHGCGIFQSDTSKKSYVNGGNEGTSTISMGASVAATEMIIGARRNLGALGTYYAGLIAEVGVWNVALTADEIASLAKGMTCDKVRPQSLQFYAPLIRNLQDLKAGVTITNNNGATVANHPRVYA